MKLRRHHNNKGTLKREFAYESLKRIVKKLREDTKKQVRIKDSETVNEIKDSI